ncbi:SIMPL domain-containing protein [Pontibacter litorisediminis]|uniref:SIMPL domain-containing protein n=1 Tax=Pontibacter litorisediminis TaxID=1846260 RepID=UPI0023EB80BC|nr:SIMPL domain-containing protein [Pontibacter litorisediminis]
MKRNITLLFLLFCLVAQAQTTSPENRIVVLGEASINVPADQVRFTVTLESTDSTSIENVYRKHQAQEAKLVALLKDLQLPARDISYSLLSLNKQQSHYQQQAVPYFMGRQTVNFTLSSVEKLSEVQARLIKGGFTNFNSRFTSTQLEKHQTQVMEKAVEVARKKANVLAKAAGRSIERVVKVADTEDTDPAFRNYSQGMLNEMVVTGYGAANLLEFPQTIPISAAVKVVFELK